MKSSATLVYSIPTSLLLFCWVTMGVNDTSDRDIVTTYGFPVSWYTPSIATSGAQEIAIGRLVMDLGIYFVFVHLLGSALKNRAAIPLIARRALKSLLWLGAALSLFFSVVVFSVDPFFTWWKLFPSNLDNAHSTHFVSVGLQPRPTQPSP